MVKAEELLRVKLGSKAGKAASRIAAEGVVAVYVNGTTGAMIEVNSETDFVAKNDDFLALANGSAKLVAEQNPADVEALGALDMNGKTVEQTVPTWWVKSVKTQAFAVSNVHKLVTTNWRTTCTAQKSASWWNTPVTKLRPKTLPCTLLR